MSSDLPPVLVSLYQVVHVTAGLLELSHRHRVKVVQDEAQTVLGKAHDVGVLVPGGQLAMQ